MASLICAAGDGFDRLSHRRAVIELVEMILLEFIEMMLFSVSLLRQAQPPACGH